MLHKKENLWMIEITNAYQSKMLLIHFMAGVKVPPSTPSEATNKASDDNRTLELGLDIQ